MSELRDKRGQTEAESIASFRARNFPRPHLTADIAVFEKDGESMKLLLIRRGGHPYLGCWALPGGFADEGETIEQTAARELEEETDLTGLDLQLVGIYSAPGRDPRGWTVSAAYTVCVAPGRCRPIAGDDAAETRWFPVDAGGKVALPEGERLAFDHARIIADAVKHI